MPLPKARKGTTYADPIFRKPTETAQTQPKYDWDQIKEEWDAPVLSLSEISKLHSVNAGLVKRHAVRHKWGPRPVVPASDKYMHGIVLPPKTWEAIAKEYIAGQLTVPMIAKMFRVTTEQIERHAKKHGWVRSEAQTVAETIKARLAAPADLTKTLEDHYQTATEDGPGRQAAIEIAVQRGVDVVNAHRGDVAKLRNIVNISAEALTTFLTADSLAEMPEKALRILGKMQGGADGIDRLASAMQRLVTLERIAYNLDADRGTVTPETIRMRVEAAKRELSKRGLNVPVSQSEVMDTPLTSTTPTKGEA